jgi:hypothetical protein
MHRGYSRVALYLRKRCAAYHLCRGRRRHGLADEVQSERPSRGMGAKAVMGGRRALIDRT